MKRLLGMLLSVASACAAARPHAYGLALALMLAPVQSDDSAKPLVVACAGDSVTLGGHGGPDDDAPEVEGNYPAFLQNFLDTDDRFGPGRFEVLNLGRSGATGMDDTDRPYDTQEVWGDLEDSDFDLAFVTLGTNDAKLEWWDEPKFRKDYTKLIEEVVAMRPGAKVVVGLPVPYICGEGRKVDGKPKCDKRWGDDTDIINKELRGAVKDIAEDLGLDTVDFYEAMIGPGGESYDEALFHDSIHPNFDGYRELGRAAFGTVSAEFGAPSPSKRPTYAPTAKPSPTPTYAPTTPAPSYEPTTPAPTPRPSPGPSPEPTFEPSPGPTPRPSPGPSPFPTPAPSAKPAPAPTPAPSVRPSAAPTATPKKSGGGSSSSSAPVAAGAGVGAALLALGIIACYCCYRRRGGGGGGAEAKSRGLELPTPSKANYVNTPAKRDETKDDRSPPPPPATSPVPLLQDVSPRASSVHAPWEDAPRAAAPAAPRPASLAEMPRSTMSYEELRAAHHTPSPKFRKSTEDLVGLERPSFAALAAPGAEDAGDPWAPGPPVPEATGDSPFWRRLWSSDRELQPAAKKPPPAFEADAVLVAAAREPPARVAGAAIHNPASLADA